MDGRVLTESQSVVIMSSVASSALEIAGRVGLQPATLDTPVKESAFLSLASFVDPWRLVFFELLAPIASSPGPFPGGGAWGRGYSLLLILVTLMPRTSVDQNKRRGWPVYVSGSPGTALKLLIASSFSHRSSVDKSTIPRSFVDSSSKKAKVKVCSYAYAFSMT